MKSMILSDIYNIGTLINQLLFAIVIVSLSMMMSTGVEGAIISSMIISVIMVVNLFAMDERSKWIKYALIMPVSRKQYVVGKYIMSGLFLVGGLLIVGILTGMAVSFNMIHLIKITDILKAVKIGFGIAIFAMSAYIPAIVKFGTEKARLVIIGVAMIPSIIVILLEMNIKKMPFGMIKGLENCLTFLDENPLGLLLLLAVILGASILISIKYIEKKEY